MTIIQSAFSFSAPRGFCERCGRELSNPLSVSLHIGPICRAKGKKSEMNDTDFCDKPLNEDITNGIILKRDQDGMVMTNVPHIVTHHSPTGFEFGYGGSGPADLALNIVEMILNRLDYRGERMPCYDGDCFQLAWNLHQQFKFKFIAPTDLDGDVIPYAAVEMWVQNNMEQRHD